MNRRFYVFQVLCLLFLMLAPPVRAQMTQQTFGKNRIQYRAFHWQFISSNNFDVYYYEGGEPIARHAVAYAEKEFGRITELYGFAPYSKIKLFIYNSMTDLQQSNVGLDADNTVGSSGQGFFYKSIIEVPYPGNQPDFRREISLGIARTLIHDMMYGGSFKDMLQSTYLMSLSDWFTQGAARYAAEGWSLAMDDYMRDFVAHHKSRKLEKLSGEAAAIAGQSFWNYIAETYGRANVSNILNLTRIIRNEETSVASTLGVPFDRVVRDWGNFYVRMAESTRQSHRLPESDARLRKNRRGALISDLAYSPSGKKLAYAENRRGRVRVIVRDRDGSKRRVVWSQGFVVFRQRLDARLPLVEWQGEDILASVYTQRNALMLRRDRLTGKQKTTRQQIVGLSSVSGLDISDDGRWAVLSGSRQGQNDLYWYDLSRNSLQPITRDLYDDLEPRLRAGQGTRPTVVFRSNRPGDTLSTTAVRPEEVGSDYDLFVYDPARTDSVLERLTRTPYTESLPRPLPGGGVLFVSDASGIGSLYRLDSAGAAPRQLTDYQQSLRQYDVAPGGMLAALMLNEGQPHIYTLDSFDISQSLQTPRTFRQRVREDQRLGRDRRQLPAPSAEPADVAPMGNQLLPDSIDYETDEINIEYYVFEIEKAERLAPPVTEAETDSLRFAIEPEAPDIEALLDELAAKSEPIVRGPFKYRNSLTTDNVSSSIYFDPLPARGLGLLFDVGMTDLFENHKIFGGAVIFNNLRSSNFFLDYQFLRHRFDFGARFEKESLFLNTAITESIFHRYNLNRFWATVSYPFSNAARLSVSPLVAQTTFTDLDPISVRRPVEIQNYYGGRIEYVFDNTQSSGLNMLAGTRAKVGYTQYWGAGNAEASFGNLMADVRHYQRLFREIVFATRLAYGSFVGPAKKDYLLGGMDNWLFANTEVRNDDPQDPLNIGGPGTPARAVNKTDWLFNQYATNLRGFRYNSIFGNSFLLLNAEFRLPIVRALYRGPISSNFFRNLQLVAFTDVGTAWSGRNPFTQDNSINTRIADPQTGFEITVINYRNPFLTGYGAGIRTMLLGYYAKFDVAWGVQDFERSDARFYLTFGYDF